MTARRDLEFLLIEGVSADIFKADEAREISSMIGTHADAVNRSTFSKTFSTLQGYAVEQFILAVTRLFDRPGRYPLRNIPAALDFVEAHADELAIEQPIVLERDMRRIGLWQPAMDTLRSAPLTREVCARLRPIVPSIDTHPALDALKAIRDKRLAHPERIPAEDIPRTTWGPAEALVKPAKDIAGILAMAYTSNGLTDDEGHYLMEYDAQQSAASLRRVLTELKIAPPPR